MNVARTVVWALLIAFLVLLLVRLVVDWVLFLSRSFRPSGVAAAALEVVYSATDPPLRFLRRLIPPLRVGSFSVDLAWMLLFLAIMIVSQIVRPATV